MKIKKNDSFPFSMFFIKVIFLVLIILNCFYIFERDSRKKEHKKGLWLYQYAKLENIEYSSWSNWKDIGSVSCDQKQVFCTNSSFCLKEEKIEKNKRSFYLAQYQKNKISIKKTKTKKMEVCRNSYYILFNNTLYQTKTDYSNIKNWKFQGRFAYHNLPKDRIDVKYLYKGSTTNNDNVLYYFDQYIYPSFSKAIISCKNRIKKQIASYEYVPISIIYQKEEENLKCYKKIRTRKILNESSFIWTKFNNQELLRDGYQYTGKKVLKR